MAPPYLPYTLDPTSVFGDIHAIEGGRAAVFSIVIEEGDALGLSVTHLPGGTDYALRLSLTDEPLGRPLTALSPALDYWHAKRIAHRIVLAGPGAPLDPTGSPTYGLIPGTYRLNVVNASNGPNEFRLELTPIVRP